MDADALPAPLATSVIRRAMEVLKVFSQDELDRDLYENRLKGQRDHQAFILARDEAIAQLEKATQQRDQATQQRDQATQQLSEAEQRATRSEQWATQSEQRLAEVDRERAQALLQAKQALSRQIQLCQRLSGREQTDRDRLMNESIDDLRALADHLEQQLPPA